MIRDQISTQDPVQVITSAAFHTITDQPTSRDLIARSLASDQSEICEDDPTYRSPHYKFSCVLHRKIPCQNLRPIGFTALEIEELVNRCPRSCNNCETSQPHVPPTAEVPMQPKRELTNVPTVAVSVAPTSCYDNPNFRDKFGFRCLFYVGTPCEDLLRIGRYSKRNVLIIIRNCKKSCGNCTYFRTTHPSNDSSRHPTLVPSATQSNAPSKVPSARPIRYPSGSPTSFSSKLPSTSPSGPYTTFPSIVPTFDPSAFPSSQPIRLPSPLPSTFSSGPPTHFRSPFPTFHPSGFPSRQPIENPSELPISLPSTFPLEPPTNIPSSLPTLILTRFPFRQPTETLSEALSLLPSTFPPVLPVDFPSLGQSKFLPSFPSRHSNQNPTDFTNIPSKVQSQPPSESQSIPPTTSFSTYLVLDRSFKTCQDDPKRKKMCSNWVMKKAKSRCNLYHETKKVFIHQVCQLTCNACYVDRLGTRHSIASPTTRPSNMYTLLPSSWPSEAYSIYPSKVPSVEFTHIPASLSHLASSTSSGLPSGWSEIHPSAIPSDLPSVASSGFTSNVQETIPPSFSSIELTRWPHTTVPTSSELRNHQLPFPSFFQSNSPLPGWTPSPISSGRDTSLEPSHRVSSGPPTSYSQNSLSSSNSPNQKSSIIEKNSLSPLMKEIPLNSPSVFPSKHPPHKESRTPTLMLNSESTYPTDNSFRAAPNEETLQSQKCEDDPTFFDNLGNSCNDYNTLGCSGLSYEKCPLACGRCGVNTRAVHASGSGFLGLFSIYKISWFVCAGVAVLICLSVVSRLVVRKQKLRTRVPDQDSVNDVVSINLIELCNSIEIEYTGE